MVRLAASTPPTQLTDAMCKEGGIRHAYEEIPAGTSPTKYKGVCVVPEKKTYHVDFVLGYGRNIPKFNFIAPLTESKAGKIPVKLNSLSCEA